MTRLHLRAAGLRAVLLISCAIPSGALAAGAADDTSATQLQELVVTAQKRSEDVQNVPIAISAFSADSLHNRSVSTISDLNSGVPNVHFTSNAQGSTTTTIGIRGVKANSVELSNEQAVATYVDGVFQATSLGSSVMLGPDLSRIEVLRGPQGTLYGRNSIGGAVNFITQAPENEFKARAMGGVGNYGRYEAQAMVNIPLQEDKAALRLNAGYLRNGGYVRELTYGGKLGSQKITNLRAQLKLNPTDRLEIIARADYLKSLTDGNVIQTTFVTPPDFRAPLTPNTSSSLFFTEAATELGVAPTLANFEQVKAAIFACGGGPTPNLRPKCYSSAGTGLPGRTDIQAGALYREYGASITGAYAITDTVSIKSISSYRDFRQDSGQDYDSSPFYGLYNIARPSGHYYTQEVQLNGALFGDRLKFAAGVFYYNIHSLEQAVSHSLGAISGANSFTYLTVPHRDSSLGPYAQVTYSVQENLRLTAGIRYSKEKKFVAVTQFGSRPVGVPQACTIPVPNPECVAIVRQHYSSVDYTVGADYDISPDALLYVRVAKGFQAGGINQRSTTGVPFQPFNPQTAINYELGLKSEFLDRRVRLNIAVFQEDVKQAQKSVARTFQNAAGNPVSVVAVVNAASERIRGAEFELTALPFEGAMITATLGYLDPKYQTFLANGPLGPNTLDLSGSEFLQAPKWSVGLSPSYTFQAPMGKVRAGLDYYYQSHEDLSPLLSYPTFIPGDIHTQKAYGLLNGRLSLTTNDGTEFALWGKNLLDKRYFTSVLDLAGSLGFSNAKVGDPRTYGVQVTHEF